MKLATLNTLNEARRRREAAIVVTDIATGTVRVVLEKDGYAVDPLREELTARFASGVSGMVVEANVFLTVHLPAPRLVIIGAVHISQAMAPMAKVAGFDLTIIDPRTAFATADRFPGIDLRAEWPDDALPEVGLDPFTAMAAFTHDPKIDDSALAAALRAGCFYVGALGSRKTHAKRLERLRALGIDDVTLSRIHAPIGIAIGAQSPAEIAVAVLAEIIATLRAQGKAAKEAAA
jgi:xanthine dehydrogenase accessory factor